MKSLCFFFYHHSILGMGSSTGYPAPAFEALQNNYLFSPRWSFVVNQWTVTEYNVCSIIIKKLKWAATWQNQQNECAPNENSDQLGHPPSLIRVFAVRMKKAWVRSYPLSAQRRLWSDWADAQADLNLRWAHSHFVGFVMSRLKWDFTFKRYGHSKIICLPLTDKCGSNAERSFAVHHLEISGEQLRPFGFLMSYTWPIIKDLKPSRMNKQNGSAFNFLNIYWG